MAPEVDVFGTGGSSRKALGGRACREENVFGMKVDLVRSRVIPGAVDVFGRIRCDGGCWVN